MEAESCSPKNNNQMSTASTSKLCRDDVKSVNEGTEHVGHLNGNRIIDINILISVITALCCPICFTMSLVLKEDSMQGLCSNLNVKCQNCDFIKGFSTSNKINKAPNINILFVYGLRLIGKGLSAGEKLCATLNLPAFLSRSAFRNVEKKIMTVAKLVAEKSMNRAAAEVKSLLRISNSNDITNCGVSVDGTWQKRGFSSLNGCVQVISIDTGKILDVEVLSQHCRSCSMQKRDKHTCSKHIGSASSMEPVGVYRLFERSEDIRKLQYNKYYGDGDSKSFSTVKDVYGKNSINKLECIGHVQKRVGSRLRKLKTNNRGLGGKGKLTDKFIDRLQNYYGIAIRSNVGDLPGMQKAVIAAFFHCCSSQKIPMHRQCPEGPNSWCRFQRNKAIGSTVCEKSNGLPQKIVNTIKDTYMQLCDQKLLSKCLHGKTQNANESFNGILWQILPKEVFVELKTLEFGLYIAIVQFNDGFSGHKAIIEELGISTNQYIVKNFNKVDDRRIVDSKRHSLSDAKVSRKKLRASKKKKSTLNENKEGAIYKCGDF